MHHADAAHDVRLLAAGDAAAAGVGGVGRDRTGDLVHADAVVQQLGRIQFQLELLGETAEVVDVGDPGHGFQRGDHDPVLQLRQLHQVPAVGLQRVAIDLAGRPGDRIEARRDPGRQRDLRDAFHHALALPVVLGAVLEHQRDQRQPERAARTHADQPGRAGQAAFQRGGDFLFDFLGGQARHLAGHLRGDVAQFRIRLDRQLGPGVIAKARDQDRHDDEQHALLEAELEDRVNH